MPTSGRPPVSVYTSFGASRKAVDRAGEAARDYWAGDVPLDDAIEEAFRIAWAFRAEFQRPLTGVVMGLRSFVQTEGAPRVVAQRLKRMPTILDKLQRHRNMKLSRMQDIGGCRAILPAGDYDVLSRIRARIAKNRWNVIEEYDYIENPKASGYRGVHVVVLRDGRLIEIQLRTEAQHRWAETVERLGSRTGYNLKDGQGPDELLDYLRLAGYGTSLVEQGADLPTDFREEFEAALDRAKPFLVRP